MEVTTAVNEHDRFKGAAMAFCNEIASRWHFSRVSLGFLRGKYVKAGAISHTEKFARKMKLVQDIEASMEECLDQDIELVYPPADNATYVSRITKELAIRSGHVFIISMPLRRDGNVIGVLTAELEQGPAPEINELEALRLTAELCTPRLANLHEHDQWFGAQLMANSRKGVSVLLGAKYTWIKLIAVLVTCVILFSCLVKGDYEVSAPFVIEPVQQRVISAPYDEILDDVLVRPGDPVVAEKTVLARLDISELESRREAEKAKYESYDKQANLALGAGKTAEAHIARQEANSILAQIKLLDSNIKDAVLVSPISGYVLNGIRPRQIGATVKKGDVLFQIAPVELLEAELFVSEKEIADVQCGQEGTLTSNSYPGKYIGFTVVQITPAAEVRDTNNVFRVRVQFNSKLDNINIRGMRPNIEGTARILVGQERYIWIWTHKLVDWIRMKMWW